MRKIFTLNACSIAIALFYLFGFSINTFGQLNELYVVRTTVSSCLNVRSDPNADAAIVTCLEPGTQVTVVNSVPFWREITFGNNQRGWVAKKFIEPAAVIPGVTGAVPIPSDAFLTINFIDVGQGDAIWIQTFDDGIDGNGIFEGYSIIIDGGPYSADRENPLLTYIEHQGFHGAEVEALFITHPHDDHYSGADAISRHFEVNHYYDPGYPSTLSSYKAFISSIKGTNGNSPKAKQIHIGKDDFGELDWGKELQAEVLYSWAGDTENTLGAGNTEVNNSSIVLRIQYGDHVFLFMGDAEGKERHDDPSIPQYVEKILLETVPTRLKSSVLKIAHHGSETSSSLPFIQAVNPDIVIVESGRRSFGGTFLPDISTLQRYCSFNPDVKIYRTDQGDEAAGLTGKAAADGDNITIRTNGTGQLQVMALDGDQTLPQNFCDN